MKTKTSLIFTVLTATSGISHAGPAFNALQSDVKNKTVYTLSSGEETCPKVIMFEPTTLKPLYDAQAEDLHFLLKYDSRSSGGGGLPYDRNWFSYRPSVPLNKETNLWRDAYFVLGIGYGSISQYEDANTLTYQLSGRVASLLAVGYFQNKITYYAKQGVVHYQLKEGGAGSETVEMTCTYKK